MLLFVFSLYMIAEFAKYKNRELLAISIAAAMYALFSRSSALNATVEIAQFLSVCENVLLLLLAVLLAKLAAKRRQDQDV